MARSSRRSFLATAPAVAVAAGAATTALADEKKKGAAAEKPAAPPAAAPAPVKKVHWTGGKAPEKQALFSPAVSYGNLLFVSGIGAHFEGDIKAHTAHVLDEMQKKLEEAGSSMQKVLKVNVYLNDLKDYAAMNEVFLGRFGPEPGVRTTIAPAGGIPGNSLVEIDCIAYI
jgi:2-iminobutanoate/2-iminopropanoate deaminase